MADLQGERWWHAGVCPESEGGVCPLVGHPAGEMDGREPSGLRGYLAGENDGPGGVMSADANLSDLVAVLHEADQREDCFCGQAKGHVGWLLCVEREELRQAGPAALRDERAGR